MKSWQSSLLPLLGVGESHIHRKQQDKRPIWPQSTGALTVTLVES